MSDEDNIKVEISEYKMWEVESIEFDNFSQVRSRKIYRFWKQNPGWKLQVTDRLSDESIITMYIPEKVINVLLKESVKEQLKEGN